jgi:hypothetical protein
MGATYFKKSSWTTPCNIAIIKNIKPQPTAIPDGDFTFGIMCAIRAPSDKKINDTIMTPRVINTKTVKLAPLLSEREYTTKANAENKMSISIIEKQAAKSFSKYMRLRLIGLASKKSLVFVRFSREKIIIPK